MSRTSFLFATSLVLLLTSAALARIEPSFAAESSARYATDIVVATEGKEIDGVLEVLETWKGSLKKGDTINVPELAEFESEGARAVFRWSKKDEPREHVTGSRMVLFLRRTGGDSPETATWAPAHSWAERSEPGAYAYLMRVSVCWIEHGEVYAFHQIMNPGDPVLVKLGMTERELRTQVDKATGSTEPFLKARAIEDLLKRAKALEPLTKSESAYEAAAAIDAIASCGSAALPVLRTLVGDSALLARRALAVKALAAAGGAEVGPDLTKILETELAYWKEAAPTASWDADSDATRHYNVDLAVLEALRTLRFQGCKEAVTKFQEAWRSLHRFAHESWFDHMIRYCGFVLLALDAPASPAAAPESPPPSSPSPQAAVKDVPMTTEDDKRRVTDLEEELAKELGRVRRLPESRRAVVGREASGGDVLAELSRVLTNATRDRYEDGRAFGDRFGRRWPSDPLPLGEKLDAAREHVSSNIAVLEPLLAADHVKQALDIEGDWRSFVRSPYAWSDDHDALLGAIDGIRMAFMLESLHALDKGDAARSARLAIDLWRFDHDLRRDAHVLPFYRHRANYYGDSSRILPMAIESLDAAALKTLDSELATLLETIPSLSSEIERRRLAVGCHFRAYDMGELRPIRSDDFDGRWKADPTPLAHLDARSRLGNRRVGAIRREWEKLDALLRSFERATSCFERPAAKDRGTLDSAYPKLPSAPESWHDFLTDETNRFLGDVATLRLMRVLVAARRFRIENERWPRDEAEAVGAELAKELTNPFDAGKPFALEPVSDELQAQLEIPSDEGKETRTFLLSPRRRR